MTSLHHIPLGTAQAAEPWFRIDVVSIGVGGSIVQREYAKIDHRFEIGKLKRHLVARCKALQAKV